jgi:hypothetical protein
MAVEIGAPSMKYAKPTILVLVLTMTLSFTAVAGNIGGPRTAGNIAGLRTSGNIGGPRTAGNIGGPKSTGIVPVVRSGISTRFDFENAISGGFAGLLRMLLESGSLL